MPDHYLFAFEESARTYGCRTDRMSASDQFVGGGEMRLVYGITAYCEEGTLALIASKGAVRIGCEKPTTRERCDGLLRKISEAR